MLTAAHAFAGPVEAVKPINRLLRKGDMSTRAVSTGFNSVSPLDAILTTTSSFSMAIKTLRAVLEGAVSARKLDLRVAKRGRAGSPIEHL